jgi:hypothetical protein
MGLAADYVTDLTDWLLVRLRVSLNLATHPELNPLNLLQNPLPIPNPDQDLQDLQNLPDLLDCFSQSPIPNPP